MARSRDEIQADLERLQTELAEADGEVSDTVDDISEVVEEAVEAHEDIAEEAAEEVAEEVEEAIEEAAEEVVEESPLAEEGEEDTATREVAALVIAELQDKYDLTPRAVVTDDVSEAVEVVEPEPEHWYRRKLW
jgi:chromosome segregation ATPase